MQVNHLFSVWSSGSVEESKALQKELDKKIDSYAAGELKHAAEVMSSIWGLSRKKEAIPSTSPIDSKEEYLMSLEQEQRERNVRTSLINSIQGKPLLHRRYWARRSQGGTACPIYFPSAVPSSTLSQIATCESKNIPEPARMLSRTVVGCYDSLEKNEGHEFPEDSDYESEGELANNSLSGNGKEQNRRQKLLPVLKIGSLAALVCHPLVLMLHIDFI